MHIPNRLRPNYWSFERHIVYKFMIKHRKTLILFYLPQHTNVNQLNITQVWMSLSRRHPASGIPMWRGVRVAC